MRRGPTAKLSATSAGTIATPTMKPRVVTVAANSRAAIKPMVLIRSRLHRHVFAQARVRHQGHEDILESRSCELNTSRRHGCRDTADGGTGICPFDEQDVEPVRGRDNPLQFGHAVQR